MHLDVNCQRCAALVDQKMNFAARLATIGWIWPCFFAAQRRRAILAVGRLPFPATLALLVVVSNHFRHHLFKDAQPGPDLKTLMGCTTRDTILGGGQRLPLTTGPQHIPTGIQHQPVRERRATSFLWLGQQRLDPFPPGFRHLKVIELLSAQLPQLLLGFAAFCTMFLAHDVSPGDGFVGAKHFPSDTSFCLIPPARISG